MPIRYQIDPRRRELFVRISGVVSDRELLDEVGRILNDPLFPKAPRVVWDARYREDVPSSNVIEPMLDLLRQHEPPLRLASFGMQRMFTLRSESIPVEVQAFRDLAEARSWLEDSRTNGSAR